MTIKDTIFGDLWGLDGFALKERLIDAGSNAYFMGISYLGCPSMIEPGLEQYWRSGWTDAHDVHYVRLPDRAKRYCHAGCKHA